MTIRPAIQLYQTRGSAFVSGPSLEPITAVELRSHIRSDITELPDDEANEIIEEARKIIEDYSGLAFIHQSWRLTLDHWPATSEAWWDGVRQAHRNDIYSGMASLELPRWPLASITSVTVYDEDSNATAVNIGTTFDVDIYSMPGRLTLKRGSTWPVALRANNAINIVYVAGYANVLSIPASMKRAVKNLSAFLYTNRGDNCSPSEAIEKSGVDKIIGIYQPKRI